MSATLISCSSDESELYEIAIKDIKTNLISPSSAKFKDFEKSFVYIKDSSGTDNPMLNAVNPSNFTTKEEMSEFMKSIEKYSNTPYSLAIVTVNYEAQNKLGVFIQDTKKLTYQKYNYKDGTKGEWKLVE